MSRVLFVSPPRRAVQFFAEGARRLPVDWLFFSVKPPVRSILKQCGVALQPGRARLDAVPATDGEIRLDNYKRGEQLRGRRARVQRRVAATLERVIDEQAITALFIWNGAGMIGASAAMIARRRGLPVLFAENGYFPDTLQLDPRGVNYASSATQIAREQRYRGYRAPEPVAAPPATAPRIAPIKPSRASRVLPEVKRLLTPAAWSWLKPVLDAKLPRQLPKELPAYLFVPLQVSKDSQLMQYSPLIGNDFGLLLDRLSAALRELRPDWVIVVKPHPAEHRRVQRQYQRWLQRWPNVVFATEPPSTALIAGCEAVVTVNSTVGFEGVVGGKPVVTLGENFYCFAPLVHPVPALDALPGVLATALANPPDAEARRAFLDYVRHEFLIDVGYRRLDEAQMRRFAEILEQRLAAAAASIRDNQA